MNSKRLSTADTVQRAMSVYNDRGSEYYQCPIILELAQELQLKNQVLHMIAFKLPVIDLFANQKWFGISEELMAMIRGLFPREKDRG